MGYCVTSISCGQLFDVLPFLKTGLIKLQSWAGISICTGAATYFRNPSGAESTCRRNAHGLSLVHEAVPCTDGPSRGCDQR